MTDDIKDLLTLAAKACGYEVARVADDGDGLLLVGVQDVWRPHINDGDGARMEGELQIDVTWNNEDGLVWSDLYGAGLLYEYYAEHNNDRQAARRWASLRAAAQIGKGMTT